MKQIPLACVSIVLFASLAGCVAPTSPVSPTASPSPPAPTQTSLPTAEPSPTSTPLPPRSEFPLSGLPADPEALRWPPIAVLIPSDSEQYAMSQASIVYEAAVEYKIPRFLAIFEHLEADKIGPIRSARPYHIEWACPYGPLLVHWGGSPQALALLGERDCIRALNGQTYGSAYFRREKDEQVPWNNQFSSSDLLHAYLQNWEIPRLVDYEGYMHKDDAPLESRPQAGTIAIEGVFSHPVRYEYDRESNTYLREYKGGPHLDLYTGEQHRANNVVVIFVPTELIPGDPEGRLEIETAGEGEALFFLDGGLIEGRWVKESSLAEMRFLDRANEDVAFNRGNIWIEVLAPGQEVVIDLGNPAP